jgi:ATPase subunit of ABC transporter with duplicated ATPase domains
MDFEPQDMSTPVRNLSRGQITKLAILKIILTPVDLLILDELTNHLDIRARENIERALTGYKGSILVATHDETLASILDMNKDIVLPNLANLA